MPNPSRLIRRIIDVALAAGLIGALSIIYVGDLLLHRGTDKGSGFVNPPTPIQQTDARPLRLGVTPPEFDDMGKLLATLGEGYTYANIPFAALGDASRLAELDVVFFTCGEPTSVNKESVKANLRNFVARGGTLYASDLRFDVIEAAFPEFVDPLTNTQGIKQNVVADVVDPALRQTIGAKIPLEFDKGGWRPAAFKGPGVEVLLRGAIKTNAGIPIDDCPLLVQFPFEEGTVVFTSFHNEKQQKAMEEKLLRHLVLATVTARTQAKVTKTMVSGGFSPQSHNLLSTSKGSPKATAVHYNKSAGRLQFVLGFENQGAELELQIVGPDGKSYDKKGNATFTIDVDQAAPGNWNYTITALKVPYPNFPFTLTVGGEANQANPKQTAVNPVPIDRTKGGFVEFKEIAPAVAALAKAKKLRLAVTPKNFDDIGTVLRNLGEGFQYVDIPINTLADEVRLAGFDVLFINCGGGKPNEMQRCKDALRSFVNKGGTIYASDQQFPTMAYCFPELVDQKYVDKGTVSQNVNADVLDAGLKDRIGPKLDIYFNLGNWQTAAFSGRQVTTLVAGNYRSGLGSKYSPLLVKFPHGEGTVIFTSFHTSKQNNDTVRKVLEYLVFTAVTAQTQATVNKTMEKNGFFPKAAGVFNHSAGNPKITQSYANKKIGPLQFAIGMQGQGAKLKFTIVAPGGGKYEKVVTSTLTVEAPAAPVGDWLYTVEALEVPYANYPFTVTVGEKQGGAK